jgi:hypothetical protein
MVSIELVYDAGCPTVEDARRNLELALKNLKLSEPWTEWERSSPFASWACKFGSPTILVNRAPVVGTTVAGDSSSGSPVQLGQTAVPAVTVIEAALARAVAREHVGARPEKAGRDCLANPFVLFLLPVACCLPLVLASLSSLSLGVLLSVDSAFPRVAGFLAVVLASLGFVARRTRRYGPLVTGVVSAGAIVLDRFALLYTPVTYGGVAMLVGASAWGLTTYWHKASACCAHPSSTE